MNRRDFIQLTAGGVLLNTLVPIMAARADVAHAARGVQPVAAPASGTAYDNAPVHGTAYKAVAFDAFPLFDPRPIAAHAERLFPGNGAALMNAWRIRQFEYQWLRALAGQYADFMQATRDSLRFSVQQLQLHLTDSQEDELLSTWSNLQVWPDVASGLQALHDAGLRLAFLSNMTADMLRGGLQRAALDHLFNAIISTDQIGSYKPAAAAYQLGLDTLQLPREQILFVAFAGWDVAGAKWFGYPTFWLNRAGSLPEQLGVSADASGPDMASLLQFALQKTTADTPST